MSYDETLAARLRQVLPLREDLTELKMFGGLAFMLDGKMFIGIVRDELMVRVGAERYDEALSRPHVRPMDFTGRPMKGYVFVTPEGHRDVGAIAEWVDWSMEVAAALPRKKPAKARPRNPRV